MTQPIQYEKATKSEVREARMMASEFYPFPQDLKLAGIQHPKIGLAYNMMASDEDRDDAILVLCVMQAFGIVDNDLRGTPIDCVKASEDDITIAANGVCGNYSGSDGRIRRTIMTALFLLTPKSIKPAVRAAQTFNFEGMI